MIIRRRHTANFTTIGNVLFEDERLAADEVGILAYLLSRPHDWEVRRPALMRRWHIGRDAMKRIVTNWMRTGWCQAQKTRLSNGTFHIIYEIRDEPGLELSDEDIRRALSLVSSEAADDETQPDGTADQLRKTGDPPTPKPGVVDRGVETHPWPIEESLNTDGLRTNPPKRARAFSDVREAWPADHILSIVACEGLHASLTDALKEAAFQGLKPYLDDRKAQSLKLCDLSTYYRERRWERFTAKASAPRFFAIKPHTPQAHRWREYLERAEPEKLRGFDLMLTQHGGYTALSEWPPAMPKESEEQPQHQNQTASSGR